MSRLRFGKEQVFKRYQSRCEAETAMQRSIQLSHTGVLTPAAHMSSRGRTVAYRRVEGISGMVAIAGIGAAALVPLMKQVLALHGTAPDASIKHFDPLKRITPRLTPARESAYARLIVDALENIDRRKAKTGLIHGDLHAGQFIVSPKGQASIAPPEADLGNFAAHLATRPEVMREGCFSSMRHWLAETAKAYATLGREIDLDLAESYGQIALVRRALKTSERGGNSIEVALIKEMQV
jgi:hypothetical protein